MTDEATPTPRRSLRHFDRDRRLAWIEERLGKYTTRQLALTVAREFDISERQAYEDIAEIAERARSEDNKEQEYRLAAARREWLRKMRKWERLGKAAEANYAYDKYCKLNGLYAPKKIELSGTISIGAQITTLVGILDAEGLKALEVIQAQIAAARAKGLLPSPASYPVPVPVDGDDSELEPGDEVD